MSGNDAGKQPVNYPRGPPPFPPPNCPRCYSSNTKFCYYNNYSVAQPRYICKECRRYWTHGGVLRNIPCGGTSRKRGRADSASSSSQVTRSPPAGGNMRHAFNNASVDVGSSDGYGSYKPEISQTMQSFNGGGLFYQPPFMFNPNYDLSSVNSAFGAVNIAFGGGATPQPSPPPTLILPQLSPFNNSFGEFGIPFVQRSVQYQPLPPPPPPPLAAWAGQNTDMTNTGPGNFSAMLRDATANVVNINEWSELMDNMDNEGDPLQNYKPPSP